MNSFICRLAVVLILATSLSLSSCWVPFIQAKHAREDALSGLSVSQGSIPPDFRFYEGVLLAIHSDENGYERPLRRAFEDYTGRVEIIHENDLIYPKRDIDEYRYYLWSDTTRIEGEMSPFTDYDPVTITRAFKITDRKLGIDYPLEVESSYFGKVIKAYVQRLNEELELGKLHKGTLHQD